MISVQTWNSASLCLKRWRQLITMRDQNTHSPPRALNKAVLYSQPSKMWSKYEVYSLHICDGAEARLNGGNNENNQSDSFGTGIYAGADRM